MTRSDGADKEIWGTREELLLACAVSRHGTQSWDSVAMEVQARIPSPAPLTAQTCKRRYRDLQRRFAAVGSRGIDGSGGDAIPLLLEELRRLRVAELRREVERYDVSIMSLQLKVRRLKEDRERSFQDELSGDAGPDPPEIQGVKEEANIPGSSPENLAVDGVRGGSSGRSCNESNSTEPKGSRGPSTGGDGELGGATVREEHGVDEIDPAPGDDEKVAGEGSYNGSSETVAKGAEVATPAEEPPAADPARRREAGESGESVAESKGEATKESSDVQSSASLSRRRRRGRRKAVSGASSVGDDVEVDELSPVSQTGVVQSQPLASFLEIIRSHKYGSMFERRLESQEGARYRSLIRQHMELAMVHGKLAEGAYTTDAEFYRDLLLLFTNAAVFFPRSSTEHLVAVKLRQLVRNQVAIVIPKPPAPPSLPVAADDPETRRPPALPLPPAPALKPETDPDPLGKTSSAALVLVVCRKRSSISGKAASRVAAEAKEEEKPGTEKKEPESTEKRTKERSSVAGSKGLRTSKVRVSSAGDAGGAMKNASAEEDVSGAGDAERKHSAAITAASVAKKRSAVNFLTRLNRGPAAAPKGTLLERLKTAGRDRGGELRKGRYHGTRQGSAATSGKQAQEQGAPSKRVGRPPKRPPPQLTPPPAKRAKEASAAAPPPRRAAAVKKKGRK